MQAAIGIAGSGRVAQALGRVLTERGECVVAVANRRPDHASAAADFIGQGARPARYEELPALCNRLLIAVADDAIEMVAQAVAEAGFCRGIVLHTSGLHGSGVLRPLARNGNAVGSMHPLQTIPSREQGLAALVGAFYALSGDAAAVVWGRELVEKMGGKAVTVSDEKKPLYHAAAVIASNYTVVLVDAACELMKLAGFGHEEALAALAPLVTASARNALADPVGALTGPVARGDLLTLKQHLKALDRSGIMRLADFYRAAGLLALQIAERRGLDKQQAKRIDELFRAGKTGEPVNGPVARDTESKATEGN